MLVPARKIGALLEAPELKSLARKAQRLAELHSVFLDCAPAPLCRASRVRDYRAGTLYLSADNAAVATKLRQLAPSLLLSIRKRAPEITGIKIAVQVREVTARPAAGSRTSATGIENVDIFRALAEKLPESPLKAAVSRLVRRHGCRE
ncbi:MAG: DciA family protein [Betaproteobacteria bacterium]